jgi:tRNA-specific 2-thiouridylase
LSGGIDSAFAAMSLSEKGHQVECYTARLCGNGPPMPSEDISAAREVCRVLNIPHTVVDLRDEFRHQVIGPFVSAYSEGTTPNPCAWCNRRIKLGELVRLVKARGFDFVATGHYARLRRVEGTTTICEPVDRRKSQVYFLSLVEPRVLEFLMLPLGEFRKADVKRLVRDAGLPTRVRDSQDLCFAATGSYRDFVSSPEGQASQGAVLDTEGNVVGTHKGHTAFTLGQRFGFRGRRWYVLEKRAEDNTIVIGERRLALKTKITAATISLFLPFSGAGSGGDRVRYRYNSPSVGAKITDIGGGKITVVTEEPCFAPAPGQVVAGYREDCLVFGGIIECAT